jgi:hypothetical protein
MCAASLHVYARQGVTEHEDLRQRAKHANVDTIQAVNVPSVVGDQRYAELVESQAGVLGAQAQKEYAAALASAAASAEPPSETRAVREQTTLEEQQPAPLTPAHDAAVGEHVVVLRAAWPGYACPENGGEGWAATVVSATGRTVVARFEHARTSTGRAYEDMRVPRLHIARRA